MGKIVDDRATKKDGQAQCGTLGPLILHEMASARAWALSPSPDSYYQQVS